MYHLSGGEWVEEKKLMDANSNPGDNFGNAVAIDGNLFVIGADLDDDNGFNTGSVFLTQLPPSADCNMNGLPDECELADHTGDGFIDVSDADGFASCLTAPCGSTFCSPALYGNPCCAIGDLDADGDVDLRDWAEYQKSISIR